MSLQVWLPLNGDLYNQGLNNMTFKNYDDKAIIDNNGKVGKCYNIDGSSSCFIQSNTTQIFPNTVSIAAWIKIPDDETTNNGYLFGLTSDSYARFMVFFNGTTNTITIYNGTNNAKLSSSTELSRNVWYHIAVTTGNGKTILYINGELNKTASSNITDISAIENYIRIGGRRNGLNTSTSINRIFYINDLRVYNHTLSAKEVEELAKGLVLHYKLDNNGLGGENLTANTSIIKTLTPSGTNTWFSPSKFYIQTTHGLEIVHNATTSDMFTVSFDYEITNVDTSFTLRPQVNRTSAQFTNVSWITSTIKGDQIPVGNSTGHFSGVFKLTSEQISNGDGWLISGLGSNNRSARIKISNFKFEQGSVATVWCPAPTDSNYPTAFNSAVYDCSGYTRNGTIIGNLTAAAGSPRYGVATYFSGDQYIQRTTLSGEINTISVWAKWKDTIPDSSVIFVDYNSKMGLGLGQKGIICGCRSSASCFSKTALQPNTWYHFVVTQPDPSTSSLRKLYINGEEKTVNSGSNGSSYFVYSDSYLRVGDRGAAGGDAFDGSIVDLRCYAAVLNETQVKELYNTSGSIDASGNVYARELVE